MRRSVLVAVASAAALAVTAPGVGAQGDTRDRVTGGGQVVLSSDGVDQAEDTIAFEAQQRRPGSTAVQGQVEYLPTSTQSGPAVSGGRWHGNVTCLEVDGNTATFAGKKTKEDDEPPYFQITVEDNGPGRDGGSQGEDVILLQEDDEEFKCDKQTQSDEYTLARGNLTVHEGGN